MTKIANKVSREQMGLWQTIKQPPWRTIVAGLAVLLLVGLGYFLWSPGLDIRDGRHDLGRNGIWISHGWLGADDWFVRNEKTNQFERYRNVARISELAEELRQNHITDVFPHLCPAESDGKIPSVASNQAEQFLNIFAGFRVMPWVGGPNGGYVRAEKHTWRTVFIRSVLDLLASHPRLAGVHLNVEPMTNGDTNFLVLLDELRAALPKDKLISIAAYPPPTRWHPFEEVHWDKEYFGQIARRSDQMAVMMYDTSLRVPKLYQRLMADWTEEVLLWSGNTPVLLGVPTYEDADVEYHRPDVENLQSALLGIHRGLSRHPLPANYQGVAIYCEWETDTNEWHYLREHFLRL